MADGDDQRDYSARSVQDVAGLTRRQQNDWDGRGALPHGRSSEEQWRRYTEREVFAIAVSAELHRRFGVPVERLKWVQGSMLKDGADHFSFAVEMMSLLGVGVWLLTDFEEVFIMDTELEFSDLWRIAFFGMENNSAFALLPVHYIVNKMLSLREEPVKLEAHGLGHKILAELDKPPYTPEEALVLRQVRSGAVSKVEVELRNGKIAVIRTTNRPDPATELVELLKEPYQSLLITKNDGKIIRISQEVTMKPSEATQ